MASKDHYNKNKKVSEATIQQIRDLGMAAAIKKAKSGASPEFIEGVRRFYPAAIADIKSANQAAAKKTQGAAKTNAGNAGTTKTSAPAEAPKATPASLVGPPAPAAVARRRVAKKTTAASKGRGTSNYTGSDSEPRPVKKVSPSGAVSYDANAALSNIKNRFTGPGKSDPNRRPVKKVAPSGRVSYDANAALANLKNRASTASNKFKKRSAGAFLKDPQGNRETFAQRNKRYGR